MLCEGPPSKLCQDAGGCNDLTCCEATCETYKHCETPRSVLDPHKQHDAALSSGSGICCTNVHVSWRPSCLHEVCGRSEKACNDHLCCAFLRQNRQQTRRNRREYRQYDHEYSAKLLETDREVQEANQPVNTEETHSLEHFITLLCAGKRERIRCITVYQVYLAPLPARIARKISRKCVALLQMHQQFRK